jgi:large-conductance mechanosensitive channel
MDQDFLSKTKNLTIGKLADTTNSVGKIIADYNIIGIALGMILGRTIADFVESINTGIVMPNLNSYLEKIKQNGSVSLAGLKMDLNGVILAIIKFISLSLILVVLLQVGAWSIKSPSKLREVIIVGIKPGLKL